MKGGSEWTMVGHQSRVGGDIGDGGFLRFGDDEIQSVAFYMSGDIDVLLKVKTVEGFHEFLCVLNICIVDMDVKIADDDKFSRGCYKMTKILVKISQEVGEG